MGKKGEFLSSRPAEMHVHEECGGAEMPGEQQACVSHSILLLPGRLPSD